MKNYLLLFLLMVGISLQAQDIELGKIFVHKDVIFVSYPNEGVMVVNNSDIRNPEVSGYMIIPGNLEVVAKEDVFYTNHYEDLVAIDYNRSARESRAIVLHRIPNVFPNRASRDEKIPIPEEPFSGEIDKSKGGSMACMTRHETNKNVMYAITDKQLKVLNISNAKQPRLVGNPININDQIETVYCEGNRLFVGAREGVHVYSLNNPERPQFVGRYRHQEMQDPVVVEGNRGYLTLRNLSGRSGNNQLQILDMSNPANPRRLNSINMTNPQGLGVDGSLLFVCDGRAGLKMYNVANASSPTLLQTQRLNGNTYDVIVLGEYNVVMCVSGNEVVQYRYRSRAPHLTELSRFGISF